MAEDRFEHEHEALLSALRRHRGECPDVESLLAYADGELEAGSERRLEQHLVLCASCGELLALARANREDVDDLTWHKALRGLERRPAPWREEAVGATRLKRWLPAAAAATLIGLAVLVAAQYWPATPPAVPGTSVPTTRGYLLQPEHPAGLVESVDRFTWSGPPVQARYEVLVMAGDDVIWAGETDQRRLAVPDELLSRLHVGSDYRWRVRAIAADGSVVGDSAWTRFSLDADP